MEGKDKLAKEKFFYNGVFYDNQEEFFKAIKAYEQSLLSGHSLSSMMKSLENDLSINLFSIKNTKIKNFEFQEILSATLIFIMEKVHEKNTTGENNV
jgi:hypothetical protein